MPNDIRMYPISPPSHLGDRHLAEPVQVSRFPTVEFRVRCGSDRDAQDVASALGKVAATEAQAVEHDVLVRIVPQGLATSLDELANGLKAQIVSAGFTLQEGAAPTLADALLEEAFGRTDEYPSPEMGDALPTERGLRR